MLKANIHWGIAPTWANFALAIPVAMIAYTGIETVSNLAEEARDPRRTIPGSIRLVAIAVFAIYFTLPLVALSALPVHLDAAGKYVTRLGLDPPNGFKNDPVLGLVENLGLHGGVLSAAKIYVGVLAATILFIATNAGVIGASRITYSMSSHRQLPGGVPAAAPEASRRRGSRCSCSPASSRSSSCCPGNVDFIGRMYAFGAMLSFTIAHAVGDPAAAQAAAGRGALPRAAEPEASAASAGRSSRSSAGSGPGSPGSSSSSRTPRPATPGSPGSRPASSSTRSTAAGSALPLRETVRRAAPARAGDRARVPDDPRPDRLRRRSRTRRSTSPRGSPPSAARRSSRCA